MAPDRGNIAGSTPDIADEAFPLPQSEQEDALQPHRTLSQAREALAIRSSEPQNFTKRGVVVGLAIGVVICFSNIYFGLQTGWISGMSMPSALIGFGFFRAISPRLKLPFSPVENVLVQTVASSVGTMPLGCGFVGVIPALEYLLKPEEGGPLQLGLGKLCLWAVGICLFGVVFAVPLRKQVIIREKLKFPTGSATALMIGVLHGEKEDATLVEQSGHVVDDPGSETVPLREGSQDSEHRADGLNAASEAELLETYPPNPARNGYGNDWKSKIRMLTIAFGGSGLYTIATYFIPQLRNIPIFGLPLARNWLWTLNPSPAYIGQGIIMGPATTMHMLFGAVLGWGILSPIAKHKGWAPGPVDDWETGSKGWIVWVSLAIMLADALVSLGWLVARPMVRYTRNNGRKMYGHLRRGEWKDLGSQLYPAQKSQGYTALRPSSEDVAGDTLAKPYSNPNSSDPDNDITSTASTLESPNPDLDAPPSHLVSPRSFILWLLISLFLYFTSLHFSFPGITPTFSLLSLLLALVLSLMGVRALGETDLNPVSGISKLTQLFFAFALPNSITLNLLAGAISESGALQAGDLLQDLKTGHLLGASPAAQFYGQLIGSAFGAIVSACAYRLYTRVYEIPGPLFQMPTAYVWIFTARLVTGSGLPAYSAPFALAFACFWAAVTALRIRFTVFRLRGAEDAWWWSFVPGGIAVAVGMYNTPSFTLARALGGLVNWWWVRKGRERVGGGAAETTVVVLASGLILGEGLCSIFNLGLQGVGVPHL